LDERLVRVVYEKFIKFFNIDVASDFEKVGVFMDSFVGSKVFEFGLRWTRKRFCKK